MDRKDDSVLYLLHDVKEILLGIGLILISIALACLGAIALFLSISIKLTEYVALFLWIGGVIFLLCGGFWVWHGWMAHKLVENDTSEQ